MDKLRVDMPSPSDVDHGERTARTAVLVDQLHAIVEELEGMHPGRKFPLDGHLVGSIGEAAAEVQRTPHDRSSIRRPHSEQWTGAHEPVPPSRLE